MTIGDKDRKFVLGAAGTGGAEFYVTSAVSWMLGLGVHDALLFLPRFYVSTFAGCGLLISMIIGGSVGILLHRSSHRWWKMLIVVSSIHALYFLASWQIADAVGHF